MAENITNEQTLEEQPLSEDIKMIIGGVATLVLILVPVILIRKLVRTVEESKTFKGVEQALM